MNDRPRIKLTLSPADRAIEMLGWFLLVGFWILILTQYGKLPDTIPTHYNLKGEADAFGSKRGILALPVLASIMYAGMTLLNRFPHIFNYPAGITPQNALLQYTFATRLIRYMKLIVVVIFGAIGFFTIRYTDDKFAGLGGWFLPVMLVLIFLPLLYYVIKMSQTAKRN